MLVDLIMSKYEVSTCRVVHKGQTKRTWTVLKKVAQEGER